MAPLAFHCTGVFFHEAGLIATAKHCLTAMREDIQVSSLLARTSNMGLEVESYPYLWLWQVHDRITVFAPAFGVQDGVLECEVAYMDAELDFAHLRYCIALQFSLSVHIM